MTSEGMTLTRLRPRTVEKPWGRRDLPPCFAALADAEAPVGEIWFEDDAHPDRSLLVKYLFTSERLSIQVHPGREAAMAAGYPDGKDEAWLVVKADENAEIGLGLRREIAKPALRDAALDGTIVDLVEWRTAAAGDFYYSPAGTIHALGAGLTLIEIQQNVDATYRLYDYGRDRELHLDQAVEVADAVPFSSEEVRRRIGNGRTVLEERGAFVVERWTGAMSGLLQSREGLPVWVIPVAGGGMIGRETLEMGDVWVVDDGIDVRLDQQGEALVAYPGNRCRSDLLM